MTERTELQQARALARWWEGRRNVRRLPWRLPTEPLDRRAMVEGLLAQTSAFTVANHYQRVFDGVFSYRAWLALSEEERVARVAPLGLPRLKAGAVTGIAHWATAGERPVLAVGAIQQHHGVGPYTEGMVLVLYGGEAVPVDTNVLRVGGRASTDGDAERWMAAMLACAPFCEPLTWDDAQPPLYQLTSAVLDLGAGPCAADAPDCDRCPLGAWLCPTATRRAVQLCIAPERYTGGPPKPKP